MRKFILIQLLTLFIGKGLFAQAEFDSAKIPVSLKENASVVIRNEEQLFEIKSPATAHYEYKLVATILNKAGENFSEMVEGYDRFSIISNIKAVLFDATGKKIKEYKSSDIMDYSMISDFSIYEDNRVKHLKFVHTSYPYTIAYSYTQEMKGLLVVPSWTAQKSFNVAVEKSSFTIKKPVAYQFNFITSDGLKTDSTTSDGKVIYKWFAENRPAIAYEPLSTGIAELSVWVKAAPGDFEFDGTKGNFSDWKSFGSWIFQLNQNGDMLPPTIKVMIQSLIKDAKTDREKINILYHYLQQNTRYVSVQLGIGGFKPITANKVAQVNYGDCKALSNFMKALLNEAGIKSNLIIIGNGLPSLNKKYASIGQANHMILSVPSKNDTLFLECTSQFSPTGFIGYNNANRDVLMVTDEGGKIVHTPSYNSNDNRKNSKAKVTFNTDSKAEIKISTIFTNAQFEDVAHLLRLEPVEQHKNLIEESTISGAELVSFNLTQPDKNKPEIKEELTYRYNQLFTKGGEKAFLLINQTNRQETIPQLIENRKTNFKVPFSYCDEDEITFDLPSNYLIEFLPKDIKISSEFGEYEATFASKEHIITYKRKRTMFDRKYTATKYTAYVDFIKKIQQADKQKAVLTLVNP